MAKKYELRKGLRKGLVAAAAIGAGLVAGAEVLGGVSAGQEITAVLAITAAVTALRVGLNWWKVNAKSNDGTYKR
jgi:hypothetical protein